MNFKHPVRIQETFSYLHEPEYLSVFAHVYWRTLLAIATALIALFSLFGIRQLMLVSELTEAMPNVSNATLPFDRTQLQRALDEFSARSVRHEALTINPPRIADPSR